MSLFNSQNLLTFSQEQYPGGPLVQNGISFQIELTVSEKYRFENIITKYPVAQATDRADNLFRLANVITVVGLLRDAFFDGVPVSGDVASDLLSGLTGNSNFNSKLSQVLNSLQLCFNTPTTYRVSTSVSKLIPSMAVRVAEVERTNKISNAFQITLEMEEIIIRDTQSTPSSAPRKYSAPLG